MVDISDKKVTKRTAIAQAILKVGSKNTINAIRNHNVPKGNVFEISKAAGFIGLKKTPEILPDCHPIPIEYANVDYKFKKPFY